MNDMPLILTFAVPVLLLLVFATFTVFIPRNRMERRARALLAQHGDAERTSCYLPFRSTWAEGKQREMDAKIAAMKTQGWTFLRAMEANPLRTILSWGGGLTLHFIRIQDSETSHRANLTEAL